MTSVNEENKNQEDLNEVYQQELENMEKCKQRLRQNVPLKLVSTLCGIGFAGTLCYYFSSYLFGALSISQDGKECFAMEFPDTKQYPKDPLVTDFEQYQGL